MKKNIFLILCITLMLSFMGCSNQSESGALKAKVGTWKTAQTIQPFFYQDNLDSPGTVEVAPFTNPGDMKTALLAESLDMAGTTVVSAIQAAEKGEPIAIVAGLSNKCSALVVGKDSGIEEGKDLRGKKIAYVPGTMHHLLLLEVLNESGLDPEKDVELIRIDFFDMGQALSQGNIDAFLSGEPYPSIAVAEGYGKILSYPYPEDAENFGTINSVMITTKDNIKNNGETIQKLVTAHAKATESLHKDKKLWIEKAAEFGSDKEVLEVSTDNIELFWDIEDSYIKRVENLAQRMLEQGMIQEIPNIQEMFDLGFLEQAQKELNE